MKHLSNCFGLGLILLSFIGPVQVNAQVENEAGLQIAEVKVLHSRILKQDRNLYIYHPSQQRSNYLPQPLPVLYLLDGDGDIKLVSGIVDYLIEINELPPLMIVGIGNFEYDRMHDLSPSHSLKNMNGTIDSVRWKTTGGGEKFFTFLEKELIPFIDSTYSPSRQRILMGHSLGGLFTIFSMLHHPDVFQHYIAVSPSLWWDNGLIGKQAVDILPKLNLQGKSLFFSDGNEGDVYSKFIDDFEALFNINKKADFSFTHVAYPTQTHSAELIRASQDGIQFVMKQDFPSELDSTADRIVGYYENRSQILGYVVLPPERFVNEKAYEYLNFPSKYNDALDLFLLNVRLYPTSPNVYDSLGDGYAHLEKKKEARSAYQKALELNPELTETRRKYDLLSK